MERAGSRRSRASASGALRRGGGPPARGFRRSNAVVYAGGVADSAYNACLPEGVLAAIEDFAAALAVAWLARLVPESDQAVSVADGEVMRALKEQRWRDAKTMAVAALGPLGEGHSHHQLRVNLWMARRELGEDWAKLQKKILGWEPPDDNPASWLVCRGGRRPEGEGFDTLGLQDGPVDRTTGGSAPVQRLIRCPGPGRALAPGPRPCHLAAHARGPGARALPLAPPPRRHRTALKNRIHATLLAFGQS